jgi:hypothetical protein
VLAIAKPRKIASVGPWEINLNNFEAVSFSGELMLTKIAAMLLGCILSSQVFASNCTNLTTESGPVQACINNEEDGTHSMQFLDQNGKEMDAATVVKSITISPAARQCIQDFCKPTSIVPVATCRSNCKRQHPG